jgi:hypothetical protein
VKKSAAPVVSAPVLPSGTGFVDHGDRALASTDKTDGAQLVDGIADQLRSLLQLLEDRKVALQLAQKQHDFKRQADELAWWLDERLAQVQAAEVGRDHEGPHPPHPPPIPRGAHTHTNTTEVTTIMPRQPVLGPHAHDYCMLRHRCAPSPG